MVEGTMDNCPVHPSTVAGPLQSSPHRKPRFIRPRIYYEAHCYCQYCSLPPRLAHSPSLHLTLDFEAGIVPLEVRVSYNWSVHIYMAWLNVKTCKLVSYLHLISTYTREFSQPTYSVINSKLSALIYLRNQRNPSTSQWKLSGKRCIWPFRAD